ncbi:MAG TPA: F0F1 ATP synthase subunit epsilon [Xanthomonadales bacterium]|nr:F0F1 ATP synthase subunit epsilon [Xanthomonadales bacterium]
MSNTFQCEIVSAQHKIFSGPASMLFASGTMGDLGIAPRHAPLITLLRPGPVRVLMPDGKEEFLFVGGGILEVQPHVVNVLADSAVRGDEIDAGAAERAKEDAERELANRTGDMAVADAEAKLAEAVAQLQALEQLRKKTKL